MFWSLFQIAVFSGCMWVFIDMPGEKNMAAAGLGAYVIAYGMTVLATNVLELARKLVAKFRVGKHQKAERAGFVRREPFL